MALGATALPTNPARKMTVRMYGDMSKKLLRSFTGTIPFSKSKTSGLSLIANKNEKSKQAYIAGYGRHFPTIMAASAM